MHLNPSTNDFRPWLVPSTVGVVAVVHLFAHLADAPKPALQDSIFRCATADTPHAATVKIGVLQNDESTLLSGAAMAAIGATGLKRLKDFFDLQAGWDGRASKPISLQSVDVFSRFFEDTGLRPERLGIFMSSQGNVVVNWPDPGGELIELEFQPAGIEYFFERSDEEGFVPRSDLGFSMLHSKLTKATDA